jgi:calcineurin-like phosphoesterase family protein
MSVYFTSDLHLRHDREFVYEARGFENIKEHDDAILHNWNETVGDEDEVYLLGDVMLSDTKEGLDILRKLKGHIHIIIGNHDSDEKIMNYKQCDNVVEVMAAAYLKAGNITFYLSHYPTLVSHGKLKKMSHALINLYGHTHQKTNFYDDGIHGPHPYMYHVGVDSHNLTPVLLEDIIEEVRAEKNAYDGVHQEDEGRGEIW